jgi:hypothetical protein
MIPLLDKMNVRQITNILERPLINIFVDMDINKIIRTLQTFSQTVNLFRIFIS